MMEGFVVLRINCLLLLFVVLFSTPVLANKSFDKHKDNQEHNPFAPNDFLKEGVKAPDFVLIDQSKKEFHMAEIRGKPVFLTFIYTSCPDMCPLILHKRKSIEKNLKDLIGEELIFVAITVDPAVDTPEVLKEYSESMQLNSERLYLLSGKVDSVKKILKKYKIKIAKVAETGQVVGHYNMGYAIDRNGIVKKVMIFSE